VAEPFRVRGVVLPEGEHRELAVVGGRISEEPAPGAPLVAEGWILPGLVDAHCHVGLDEHGPVAEDVQEEQALADRDAGTLLIRDAGSAADTRWIDDRDDLPVMIRAGRHLARTKRYIRNYGHEIEPEQLPEYVAHEARRSDGWVKLVGDWIDRDVGDLAPCWPRRALDAAIETAHALGARVTAHVFGEDALPDLLGAGIDCIEHGTASPTTSSRAWPSGAWRWCRPPSSCSTSRSTPRPARSGFRRTGATCASCSSGEGTPSRRHTTPESRSTPEPTPAACSRTA
jgi:hypothetical protein